MIDEVILRYFYAQLVRFLCPYMDNKRQPRAAKPILGSLRWLQKRGAAAQELDQIQTSCCINYKYTYIKLT